MWLAPSPNKATHAEAQDIWVVWRMSVDCQGC